jgi:hypothetical protein
LKLVGEPRRVKEERPIIGGRTNIEGVLGEKPRAIAGQNQATVVGGAGPGSYHLHRLGGNGVGFDAGRVQDRELQIVRDLPELRDARPR